MTHEKFVNDSKYTRKDSDLMRFTANTFWHNWKPVFIGYVGRIPGRYGMPLSYVVREDTAPTLLQEGHNMSIIKEYELCARVGPDGIGYETDNAEVFRILETVIVGNLDAETLARNVTRNDGRGLFDALKEKYEGFGAYQGNIKEAETLLTSIFYTMEKPPNFTWDKYEGLVKEAHAIVERHYKRPTPNEQKLQYFVEHTRKSEVLKLQHNMVVNALAKEPLMLLYDDVMHASKQLVLASNPNTSGLLRRASGNDRRTLREATRGKSKAPYSKKSKLAPPAKAWQNKSRNKHLPERQITLSDGRIVDYHPSYHFPYDVLQAMKPEDKTRMTSQRAAYKKNRKNGQDGSTRQMQQAQLQIQQLQGQVQSLLPPPPMGVIPPPSIQHATDTTQISQVTTGTAGASIMGGRNSRTEERGNGQRFRFDPWTGQRL